jgi:hypothetical protein
MRVLNSNESEDPLPYLEKYIKSLEPPEPDEIDWYLLMKWAMKNIKKEPS